MRKDVKIDHEYSTHQISIVFPNKCGICQEQPIDPKFLFGKFGKGDCKSLFMESVFQCSNCKSFIIGYYKRANLRIPFELINISPNPPDRIQKKTFSPEIIEVSPRFVNLYNQLHLAEEKKLEFIIGIGYRKALEFLIKDYLIYLDPKIKEKIETASLRYCLSKIENNHISAIAKNVSWFGRDEDLYTRQWNGKDVNDLKKLNDLTSSYITSNIQFKKHLDKLTE